MSGTFFGFNTALKGLYAHQKAMNTTAHNISNADTPGYTRQQAVMAADFAFPVPSLNKPGGAGQVGTGVNVIEMRRIRDVFLDKQVRTELANLGQWEQRAETLKLVETAFIEPSDDGLSSLFNEFWKAWQELSKNAENVPIRTSLIETAVSLADALNHAHTQLARVIEDLEFTAETKALQVNTLSQQIDDLNQQIAKIQLAGDAPNDLKDKRDLLLDELAKLVDFKTEETMVLRPVGYTTDEEGNTKVAMGYVPDGQIRVYIGNEDNPAKRDVNDYLVHVNGKYTKDLAHGDNFKINNSDGEQVSLEADYNQKEITVILDGVSTRFTLDEDENYFVDDNDNRLAGIRPILDEDNNLINVEIDFNVNNVNHIGFDIGEDGNGEPTWAFKWAQEIVFTDSSFDYKELDEGKLADNLQIKDGELFGILHSIGQVQEYIGDLDQLAFDLATRVNQLHNIGVGLDGSTGLDFFLVPDSVGNASANIEVNQILVKDINKIAASIKYFEGKIVETPDDLHIWEIEGPGDAYFNLVGVPVENENGQNEWKFSVFKSNDTGFVSINGDETNGWDIKIGDDKIGTIKIGGNEKLELEIDTTTDYEGKEATIDGIVVDQPTDGSIINPVGYIQEKLLLSWNAELSGSVDSGNNGTIENIGMVKQEDGNWYVLDPLTGEPVDDHNGGIALEIAKIRPETDRQYDQLVSRIGVKTNEARRRTDGQSVLIDQLDARKESISGVNLDEEMAMMLQFQRIYQASATMINTLDEMIQTVLAMKR